MLQTFRDNLKGTVAYILVGLIVVIFALTGAEALFSGTSTQGKAASVNGETISEVDVQRAIQMRRQQMMSRFGDQLPAELVSDQNLRKPAITQLVQRQLLQQQAADNGMGYSEQELEKLIVEAPQFQQDGKFSKQLYVQLLRNMGYTPASYKKQLTDDLVIGQLSSGLLQSAFVTADEVDANIALAEQTRDFSYITLPLADAEKSVELTDQDITEYFEANKTAYTTSEKVAADYIDVNVDALAADIEIDDATLKQQYEEDIAAFDTAEQRLAALS